MVIAVLGPNELRLIEEAKRSFREDYGYLLKVVNAAQVRRSGRSNLRAVK